MEAWAQTGFSLAVLWFLMRAAETCVTAVRSSTDGWEAAPASSGTPIGAVAHLPPVPLSFPPPAALPCPHLPTLHSFLPFSGACRALPLSPLFPKPFRHQFYTLPSFGLPFSLKLPHFPDPILLFLILNKPIQPNRSVSFYHKTNPAANYLTTSTAVSTLFFKAELQKTFYSHQTITSPRFLITHFPWPFCLHSS